MLIEGGHRKVITIAELSDRASDSITKNGRIL